MFEMFVLSLSALAGNFDDSGVNYKVCKCHVLKILGTILGTIVGTILAKGNNFGKIVQFGHSTLC